MEWRRYGANQDCNDADLERGEFEAERVRENVERRLGGGIDACDESVGRVQRGTENSEIPTNPWSVDNGAHRADINHTPLTRN